MNDLHATWKLDNDHVVSCGHEVTKKSGSGGSLCRIVVTKCVAAHLTHSFECPHQSSSPLRTLEREGSEITTRVGPLYTITRLVVFVGFNKECDHNNEYHQPTTPALKINVPPTGVSLIKDLADEVDGMTSEVVSAALDVRRTPGSKEAREKLDSLRQSWASKVQELTAAIDDVIDPEDFVTISGESDNGTLKFQLLEYQLTLRGKHPTRYGKMP